MRDTGELAGRIRIEWSNRVTNVCQAVIDEILDADPSSVNAVVQHLMSELPAPANRTESLLLRHSLSSLINHLERTIHDRFHLRFGLAACGSFPSTVPEGEWLDPARTIEVLLNRWRTKFLQWLYLHHTMPLVLRAKQMIQEQFAERLTISELTQTVGASRTVLIERFRATFGVSPYEYLARVRVREGMLRLRRSPETVDEIARQVGYQSGGNFYARLRRYTGLIPSQVRELTNGQLKDLLESHLSLRAMPEEHRGFAGARRLSRASDRRKGQRRCIEQRRGRANARTR